MIDKQNLGRPPRLFRELHGEKYPHDQLRGANFFRVFQGRATQRLAKLHLFY